MKAENTIKKDDEIINVLSTEGRVFPPTSGFTEKAHIKGIDEYNRLYAESIEDPEGFWSRMADIIDWSVKWESVCDVDMTKPEIKWFSGGRLNAAYNCLDRHLLSWRKNKAAIIWEGDDGATRTFTYGQLSREVARFACVLRKKGIKRGDRVTLYLPMIPELVIAALACARLGAIHSVVFGGFSAAALRDRINGCESRLLVTADKGLRGARHVPLKKNADEALAECPSIETVIVVRRVGGETPMQEPRDSWYHEEMEADDVSDHIECVEMEAEDPLFILYTSGSTGSPKGVVHTTGGYLVYAALTFKWIFDYRDEDVYFCTADIGWITGHSYIIYGPLAMGATCVIFEGIPTYPAPDRYWRIIEKHRVNIFYTAPTAIRALMSRGDKWVRGRDLTSLRLLGSVGEPINPEAWIWYHEKVGGGRLPIVDTWWQTETGGILISPLPGATTLKPGSASRPFFGISAKILKKDGTEANEGEGGYLVIEKPWPAMIRGTYGDPENKRMKELYFSQYPGKFFTGDSARVDRDGDFWLMGRVDDVLSVAGHRLGTAEIESALVSHEDVSEAAIVGVPHEIKGEAVYAFVVLNEGVDGTEELKKALEKHVRAEISPIAKPDSIQFAEGLPKTRSGKIMRRILRKIARGDSGDLGDISTLADPTVVEKLIKALGSKPRA